MARKILEEMPPRRIQKLDTPSREELARIIAAIDQQKEDEKLANTSPQNLKHIAKVKKADERTRATAPSAKNVMEHIVTPIANLYSPTQQFGAIVDMIQGEKGYWEGIHRGNSGFVTDKFAKEHPYLTTGVNLIGDIGSYSLSRKGLNTLININPYHLGKNVFNEGNSFTRGVGGIQGLKDLGESGLVRGNPLGSEISAKMFGKMYRRNRYHFKDIMDDTNLPGIENRYFNRSLSKKDFDAIKQSSKKFEDPNYKFDLYDSANSFDPLSDYKDYDEYLDVLDKTRKGIYQGVTTYNKEGHPAAYFYNDGRNPLTEGHDYANSTYGVKISNASNYEPKILSGHQHYSLNKTPRLTDSNVEVYKRLPFGLVKRINKKSLIKKYSNNN